MFSLFKQLLSLSILDELTLPKLDTLAFCILHDDLVNTNHATLQAYAEVAAIVAVLNPLDL